MSTAALHIFNKDKSPLDRLMAGPGFKALTGLKLFGTRFFVMIEMFEIAVNVEYGSHEPVQVSC